MRDPAAGTLLCRATKDANSNVHPISITVVLASECNYAVDAMMAAEEMLLSSEGHSSPLDNASRVTVTDGGPALVSRQKHHHPDVALWRCEHHLKAELARRCRASLKVYNDLVEIPHGRLEQADTCLLDLPEASPLMKMEIEHICQAYLPNCNHGVTTSNFAEITNHMLESARTQEHLFNSMLAIASVLENRKVCSHARANHTSAPGHIHARPSTCICNSCHPS
jgi:hypothetical protein